MSKRIAVIDDEQRMVDIIGMLLRREGYVVDGFSDPEAGLAAMAEHPYDAVLTDLKMPKVDGIEVLRRAKAIEGGGPIILMTAYADVPTAITAMREGAFDYVQKPFDNDELKALVARAIEVDRLDRENRYLRGQLKMVHDLDDVIAESPAMQRALAIVRRVAPSKSTVLITGESGTGKELIARSLHYYSERVGGPFVAANCKAFASGVLESELFGHEKGAFTGADRNRPGLFERADGGTLFLDEIGEIDESFQAKLLRVLQERTVVRVGGDVERSVDVRLVAATNRDLRAEADAKRFREDLYFRLAVIPVALAPLRDRTDDIVPLARHFLARFNEERAPRLDGWTEEVQAFLTSYQWPGNVRELENVIERAAVLAVGQRIEMADLLIEPTGAAPAPTGSTDLQEVLDRAAAEHIRSVLDAVGGKRQDAARRLGVERTTLYRLMKKFELG